MLSNYDKKGVKYSLENLWTWTEQNFPDNFTIHAYKKWLDVSPKFIRKKHPDLSDDEIRSAFDTLRAEGFLDYIKDKGRFFYALTSKQEKIPDDTPINFFETVVMQRQKDGVFT